jgi:glycosyltransferase involved in cell wall biosynthesis
MKLTIIIPALNEAATIGKVLNDIPESIPGISEIVAVVIDDGSSDDTMKIAERNDAIVIRHIINTGLGSAFRSGLTFAINTGADIMVNIDADGQFYPQDIPRLVAPIVDGEAECTTASRFIDKKLYPEMNIVKFYGNKAMSLLISFLTGQRFYDVSCGMRAYNRHALLHFNLAGRFTYTQEAILNLAYKGIIIKEVPIKVIGKRQNGESKIASNLFRYAFRTSSIIFRAFRDYKPLYFFGVIALFFFMISSGFFLFLFIHYLQADSLFPHKWAGFAGIVMALICFACLIIGLVADMLDRIRMNQEKIIYLIQQDKAEYARRVTEKTEKS